MPPISPVSGPISQICDRFRSLGERHLTVIGVSTAGSKKRPPAALLTSELSVPRGRLGGWHSPSPTPMAQSPTTTTSHIGLSKAACSRSGPRRTSGRSWSRRRIGRRSRLIHPSHGSKRSRGSGELRTPPPTTRVTASPSTRAPCTTLRVASELAPGYPTSSSSSSSLSSFFGADGRSVSSPALRACVTVLTSEAPAWTIGTMMANSAWG